MNIHLEALENVLNKIYTPSFRIHLRKKFQLQELGENWANYKDVEFYAKRNLIVGINGEIFNHKTTGPCLLPTIDISILSNNRANYREILEMQPTLQNVILTAVAAKGNVHVCLETKEFANMLNGFYHNEQNYLDDFIEVAKRTCKMTKNLMEWWNVKNSKITLHYTHESKVDDQINYICSQYHQKYIDFLLNHNPKSNYFRIGKRLKNFLEQGNKPEEIYRLRVVSTYFPGWWGDKKINEHTIVENVFHDAWLFTKLYSKTSMVGLLPPKDLSFKKSEMDVGQPLYLGTETKLREGIKILKATRFPKKNRYNCIVGNLLLFAVKNIEDFHCIESCGRKKLTCNYDCRCCLDILEEFLYKISGI
ncbi:MAG: hypothetical protein ACTSRG_18190 [Candidatus Helarchaeota archaeon]